MNRNLFNGLSLMYCAMRPLLTRPSSLVSVILCLLLITVIAPGAGHAQSTQHEIIDNQLDEFAFDPPLAILGTAGKTLQQPQHLGTHRDFASSKFAHLVVTDQHTLRTGLNSKNPGYLGVNSFRRHAGLPDGAREQGLLQLGDVNGDRRVDAIVAEQGGFKVELFSALRGHSDVSSLRPRASILGRTRLAITDIALDKRQPRVLGVLHRRSLELIDFNLPATNINRRSNTEIKIKFEGTHLAAHTVQRDTLFAVLGTSDEQHNELQVGLYRWSSEQRQLKPEANFTFTSVADLQELPVDIALANIDSDSSPEVIVLTQAFDSADGLTRSGRVRVFKTGRNNTLRLVTQLGEPGLTLRSSQFEKLNQCTLDGDVVSPVGLRISDIAAVKGRDGPGGRPEIIVAGELRNDKCELELPFVQTIQTDSRLQMRSLATAAISVQSELGFSAQPDITDLETGLFNADSLPDVALLDRANNAVIVLRQQPRPCVTFITPITHGHRGLGSITAAIGQSIPSAANSSAVPRAVWMDDFNQHLTRQVNEINVQRRQADPDSNPPTPELCPIAHMAVNGHWEQATSLGAMHHVLERALWVASAVLPTPGCFKPLVLSKPNPTPLTYWASKIWLMVPPFLPANPECVVIPGPDFATVQQVLLGAIAAGTEVIGRNLSAPASRVAASALSDTIDDAVSQARSAMDTCSGQLAIDAVGFSRGTTVTSAAMAGVDNEPLRYNADASILYLDAIDPSWGPPWQSPPLSTSPSNGDSIRPWARSGVIVGDPVVRGSGSAKISAVYAGKPDAPVPFLAGFADQLEAALDIVPLIPADFHIQRDAIGLPSGYDRSAVLASNPIGWMASATERTHGEVRADIMNSSISLLDEPESFSVDPEEDFPRASFANATHLGEFLREPRRILPDYTGWRRGQSEIDEADETRFMPNECQSDASSVVASSTVSPIASATRSTEFVFDADFNLTAGLVANARELIELNDSLPGEFKAYKLGTILNEPESAFIQNYLRTTAEIGVPPGKTSFSWNASANCRNCPRFVSSQNESRVQAFIDRFEQKVPDVDPQDSAQDLSNAVKAWNEQFVLQDNMLDHNHINFFNQTSNGGNRSDDALLHFGPKAGSITQHLSPVSRGEKRFVVRVVAKALASNAALVARVRGDRLNQRGAANADNNGDPVIVEFSADRDTVASIGHTRAYPDSLSLYGRNVSVSSVSVRQDYPVESNDRYFEVVAVPGGLDWAAARALAETRVFKGKNGKLAEFADTSAIKPLLEKLESPISVWLGAEGEAHNPDSFRWISSNTPLPPVPVQAAPVSPLDKLHNVFATSAGELRSSGERVTHHGEPIGVLIAY